MYPTFLALGSYGLIASFPAQAQPTWQRVHGNECAVLNVSTLTVWEYRYNDGTSSTSQSASEGSNEMFDTRQECMAYYNHNYHKESKEHTWWSYRYAEQVKHLCVPCSTVYGGSPAATMDCESRAANIGQLKANRTCFTGANEAVYGDLNALLGEVDCGIYLGEITCSGKEIRLSWYGKDGNGTVVNVPNDRRGSIDRLYADLKTRSKERQVREVQRQMEQAQRREDVERLMSEVQRLVADIKATRENAERRDPDEVWLTERERTGKEPSILPKDQGPSGSPTANPPSSSGMQTLEMDLDGDGRMDKEATIDASGRIIYRDIGPVQGRTDGSLADAAGSGASALEIIDPNGEWSAAEQKQLGMARRFSLILNYVKDPRDKEAYLKLFSEGVDMVASKAPLTNVMWSRFGPGIPDLMNGTYSAMADACVDLLEGRDPGQGAMYRPTANWLGRGAFGIDDLGDRAAAANGASGNQGIMDRIWKYFMDDLREKLGQP